MARPGAGAAHPPADSAGSRSGDPLSRGVTAHVESPAERTGNRQTTDQSEQPPSAGRAPSGDPTGGRAHGAPSSTSPRSAPPISARRAHRTCSLGPAESRWSHLGQQPRWALHPQAAWAQEREMGTHARIHTHTHVIKMMKLNFSCHVCVTLCKRLNFLFSPCSLTSQSPACSQIKAIKILAGIAQIFLCQQMNA